MTSEEYARRALKSWYDAAGLSFKGVSFDRAYEILTVDATIRMYPVIFGDAVKSIGLAKSLPAMQELGAANPGQIPHVQYFFEALTGAVDPYRIKNFIPIVVDSVKDSAVTIVNNVSEYGTFGIKAAYYIGLAALAVYALSMARRLS